MSIIHFFDLETTGLYYKNKDRILEYAILSIDPFSENCKQISEKNSLINPKIYIPAEATKIHGITNSDVKTQPEFKDKVEDFFEIFKEGSYVAGHNIFQFDIPFVFQEMIRLGYTPPENFYIVDTLKLARKFLKGLPSYKLDALCDYFKIDRSSRTIHNALIDCKLNYQVFLKLRELYDMTEDLILVDKKYIEDRKLNYEVVDKKDVSVPEYLKKLDFDTSELVDFISKEKTRLPYSNFANSKIVSNSIDVENKEFIAMIQLISKYKIVSMRLLEEYFVSINLLDSNFNPTDHALENNLIKYKIKNSQNRVVIYFAFCSKFVSNHFVENSEVLKDLKTKTVEIFKKHKEIH